jgi:phosphoglycolate phosphatase-like HAD superfamily hydrolase
MHIFFDVDHTIIDSDNRLRPGVRELFERLQGDGHSVYLWSGIGVRTEIVEAYGLGALVVGCYDKPLYQYERMLAPLGIPVRPDFVVDDHPHLVHAFGGCVVSRYLAPDPADREMERVYAEIGRAAARRPAPRTNDT